MPTAGAQLRAKLADRTSNPVQNVGNPNVPGAPGLSVFISLTFQGVNYKPEDIYDALESKYGAGKISSDLDLGAAAGSRPLQFRITQ